MDFNPLHLINELNNAIGHSTASVLEFLHLTDPAVSPAGVREVAKKWRALAGAVEDADRAAQHALHGIVWEGKAADAFAHRAGQVHQEAGKIAGTLHQGATAIDKFATEADDLISQIGNICAQIEEMEAAGLALDVLTEGFASCAATIAAGERATQVVALITRIEESGSTLGSVIRTIAEAIRSLDRVLEALKDIKGVATVAKWAGEGMKFAALGDLLQDPSAFTHPGKLMDSLAEGALMGIGFGAAGKGLGKALDALSPAALGALSKTLCKLDDLIPEGSKLRPGEDDGIRSSIANALKRFKQDPIDVVTGEMMIAQTDAALPGILPLVLERTHLSSYRTGGWFGPSWASTLDQRLQLDADGVVLATADGLRLCYQRPEPGVATFPERGPRRPLLWDGRPGSRMRVTNPATGHTLVFAHPTGAGRDGVLDLPLQAIEDRNGNWIRIHHSVIGVPIEIEHHGGYRIAVDRHPDRPRITAYRLLDADGPGTSTPLMRFGYDDLGHLTEVVNSSGLPLRYTYDHAGRITSWTDRNHTSYHYTYDTEGRCVRGEGSGGFQSGTFVYDTAHRTTRVTDALSHTFITQYNEALRPVRETDPLGNVTITEWDDTNEHVVAVTDPLGRITRYEYDETGNVTAVERPDGTAKTAAYNELNLPVTVTEPDGGIWRYTYDFGGNRLSATDPDGSRTEYAYDAAGGLVAVVNALGHTWQMENNSARLPVLFTDPLGHRTVVERDRFGRHAVLTDALENTTRIGWSVEGHPLWRERSDGTRESWRWDGEGNLAAYADPTGNTTIYRAGPFDLPVSRTSSDGSTHSFEYDGELNLTKVTNSQGLSWTYEYDPVGRLTSETDFDGRTLNYTRDAAGRLVTRTNALGQTVTYQRDALGQVSGKDADGLVTTYTHDPVGRLLQAAGPDAAVTYRHDRLGRVVSETCNDRTMAFTYDPLGNLVRRTTPAGHTSTWTYDSAGRPTTLATAGRTVDFEHDPVGRESTRRFGEDLTLTQAWDPIDRLTAQTLIGRDSRTIQRRAYTYRADECLAALDDHLNGPHTYDLDATGRVTAVHAGDWAERYAYDEAGNQTTAQWPLTHAEPEAIGDRAYTGTRLTRAGSIRYEHDAQGRIVLRQKSRLSRKPDTWRYTWDAEDRLTAVTTPDGTVWRYLYDPLGRRIAKQRLGDDGAVLEHTDFAWDGVTLAEEATATASRSQPVILTWDHIGSRPIAQTESRSAADASQDDVDRRFYAIVTDLVGTPSELVDEQGGIAWRTRSTLWGNAASATDGSTSTPLRFPGQYFDPESGLHYNVYRYYDPATGRYVTADPLGLEPSPNPRGYVTNPHREIDPLGLMSCVPRVFAVDSGGEAASLPVHEIDSAVHGPQAANFLRAVNDGAPALVTRRAGGEAATRAVRRQAQAHAPRPTLFAPNGTWEEYPFASTVEGGKGATLTLSPRSVNSSHGWTLKEFYKAAGLKVGDQYVVRIV